MSEKILPMVTLTIDGQEVTVPQGTTVYHACKQLEINIPIFCYLDRLPPFGACRVCMVEVEKMAKPQTSCTLEVKEGMVVKTQSALAEEARKQILEFLLINHPLDCPICDRAGECPLQDNTLHYGPGLSRFFEEKRKFKKPLPLGPVLMLDRERCISCARCTRFSDEISGDHALQFIERGYKTEVGTPGEKPAESKYIGNTIMICPVGALTSQVYRFRARPWDNDSNTSSCTLCPVGCSAIFDSRDGEIMRVRSRENKHVNDIWLCDKGWFGYEFVYHPDRLMQPLIRKHGKLEPASWEEALSFAAKKIEQKGKVAGLGGNPLTFEENFLFQQLIRKGAHSPHVDHRIGVPIVEEQDEGIPPGMEISIGQLEELTFVLLIGVDLTEEFPVIWLRLRQALNKGAKVIYIGHFGLEISSLLTENILHSPGEEIKMLEQHLARFQGESNGAVFVGRQYLNTHDRKNILSLLHSYCHASHLSLNIMEGRGNSLGARLAGMHPEFDPFGKKALSRGMNAHQVFTEAAAHGWDLLYVAGSNPAIKMPSSLWKEVRAKLGCLVVQDLFLTETAEQADVVLPTLSFIEKEGSFINIEGRIQKLHPGKAIPKTLFSDLDIFKAIAKKIQLNLEGPPQQILTAGQKIPIHRKAHQTKQRQQARTTKGNLLATFTHPLFDHGVRMRHNPHLFALSKGPYVRISPKNGAERQLKTEDPVNIIANGTALSCKVKLDEKVSDGTIVLPLGFEKILPIHELSTELINGMEIEIQRGN